MSKQLWGLNTKLNVILNYLHFGNLLW